jgi:hypothetical protein
MRVMEAEGESAIRNLSSDPRFGNSTLTWLAEFEEDRRMPARALLAVGFAAAAFSGAFAQAVPAAVASCDLILTHQKIRVSIEYLDDGNH